MVGVMSFAVYVFHTEGVVEDGEGVFLVKAAVQKQGDDCLFLVCFLPFGFLISGKYLLLGLDILDSQP